MITVLILKVSVIIVKPLLWLAAEANPRNPMNITKPELDFAGLDGREQISAAYEEGRLDECVKMILRELLHDERALSLID